MTIRTVRLTLSGVCDGTKRCCILKVGMTSRTRVVEIEKALVSPWSSNAAARPSVASSMDRKRSGVKGIDPEDEVEAATGTSGDESKMERDATA